MTLTDKHHLESEDVDLSQSKTLERILTATRAAFLLEQERQKLIDELKLELI